MFYFLSTFYFDESLVHLVLVTDLTVQLQDCFNDLEEGIKIILRFQTTNTEFETKVFSGVFLAPTRRGTRANYRPTRETVFVPQSTPVHHSKTHFSSNKILPDLCPVPVIKYHTAATLDQGMTHLLMGL